MDSLEAVIETSRNSPDELYRGAFLYFQALLHPLKADASKIQLPSHLPESTYNDRRILGLVITAALIAILDHRKKIGGGTTTPDEMLALAHNQMIPLPILGELDDIILDQTATLGSAIFASELAHSRWFEWERHDYGKVKRGLRALDKAARIHQRITALPLTDPLRHEVKKRALTELSPFLKRLQETLKSAPVRPTIDDILKTFERDAGNARLFSVSNSHNLDLWMEFLRFDRRNAISLLSWSPAEMYDQFQAFVTMHKSSDYTRRNT